MAYQPLSIEQSQRYLKDLGHEGWSEEIALMIQWHHRAPPTEMSSSCWSALEPYRREKQQFPNHRPLPQRIVYIQLTWIVANQLPQLTGPQRIVKLFWSKPG